MNIKQFNNLKAKAKRNNTTLEKVVKDSRIKDKDVKIVNGYVIYKADNTGRFLVYNNEGHFEEDKYKGHGYPTLEMAIKRAKSLPKGIAVDSIKDAGKVRNNVFIHRDGDLKASEKLYNELGHNENLDEVVVEALKRYPQLNPFDIELVVWCYYYKQLGIGKFSEKDIQKSVIAHINTPTRKEWYGDSKMKDSYVIPVEMENNQDAWYSVELAKPVTDFNKATKFKTYAEADKVRRNLGGRFSVSQVDSIHDAEPQKRNPMGMTSVINMPPDEKAIYDRLLASIKKSILNGYPKVKIDMRDHDYYIDNKKSGYITLLLGFENYPDDEKWIKHLQDVAKEYKGGLLPNPPKPDFIRLLILKKKVLGDSIHDVDPKPNETKQEFIARFMNETKAEYPNEKQRYAVANSYWENKGRDSVKDADMFTRIVEGLVEVKKNITKSDIYALFKQDFAQKIIEQFEKMGYTLKDSIGDAEIEEGTLYRRNGDGAEIWVVDKSSFGRYRVMMRNPETTRGEWTSIQYKNAKDLERIIDGLGFKKVKDSIHDSYIIYSPSKEYVKRQRYAGSNHLDILESDSSIFGLKCEILSYTGGNGYGEVKISGDRNKLERFMEREFNNLRKPKIQDSIKTILGDNAEIVDEDIDELSEEEKKAIEDYKQAIAGTQDVRLLELYSHILKEEIEHLEELDEAKGMDSVRDGIRKVPKTEDDVKKLNSILSKKWQPSDIDKIEQALDKIVDDDELTDALEEEFAEGWNYTGAIRKRLPAIKQEMKKRGVPQNVINMLKDSVRDLNGADIVKLERINERLNRNDADSWNGYLTSDEMQYIIELLKSKSVTIDKLKQVAPIIYREYGSQLEKRARDSVNDQVSILGSTERGVPYSPESILGISREFIRDIYAESNNAKDFAKKINQVIKRKPITLIKETEDVWKYESIDFMGNKHYLIIKNSGSPRDSVKDGDAPIRKANFDKAQVGDMLIWIGEPCDMCKQPMTIASKDKEYIIIRLLKDRTNWKVSKPYFEKNFKVW